MFTFKSFPIVPQWLHYILKYYFTISRTTFFAFSVSCPIKPAYNTEVALSKELLMGIPEKYNISISSNW